MFPNIVFPPLPTLPGLEALSLPLLKAPPKERTAKIAEVAHGMIALNPQGTLHWKAFALTAAEFSSRFKSLANGGLNLSDVCDVWLSILLSWQKNQGFFFKEKLKNHDLGRVIGFLENIKTLELILESPLVPIETAVSSLQEHLLIQLKTGPTYIPLVYTGGKVQVGHALILKAEERGDALLLTLYNRGDGSELHPIVDLTPNSRIPSIRYFPIAVDKAVFFGEEGKIALSHLVHYMREPAPDTTSLYEAWELYSILQTLGKPMTNFKDSMRSTYAKEPQVTGNCAVTAVEHVMLDALVEMGYSDLEIKKIMLNMHLCFLIRAHLEYLKDPSHSYHAFVQESTSVLGADLQSLKNQISPKEFIFTACSLIQISSVAPPSPLALELSPSKDLNPISTPSTTFTKTGPLYEELVLDDTPILPSVKSLWPPPEFQPQNALAYFKNALAMLRQLSHRDKVSYFEAVLTRLPIPQHGKKGAWDEVPEKEILPLLKTLKTFAEERFSEDSPASNRMISLVYLSAIYSIADTLVRRTVPQLGSYASSFIFLDKGEIHEFPLLHDGYLNSVYTSAYNYFKEQRALKDDRTKEVIFPIEPTLPIQEEFYQISEGGHSIGISHLRFLSQFINSQTTARVTLDALIKTWMGEGLPEELSLLYHFSYLTHYAYRLGDSEQELPNGLPNGLMFIEVIEEGTRHLKISLPKEPKTKFFQDKELKTDHFLFSDEIQDVDTNRAALAQKKSFSNFDSSLSDHQVSELLRIWNLSCPNLRFHQALQFMRNHKESVVEQNAKSLIIFSLLAPRVLFEAVQHTPDVAQTIRVSCYELIQFYANQPAQRTTLSFLLDLLILLETQLHAAKAPPLCQEHLRFYLNCVENGDEKEQKGLKKTGQKPTRELTNRYLIQSLFLSLGLQNKSLQEWGSILHKGLILEEREITHRPIELSTIKYCEFYDMSIEAIFTLNQIFRESLPDFFKNLPPAAIDPFCNQLVSNYLESPINLKWQIENGCFKSSQLVIDVYAFKLQDLLNNVYQKNPSLEDEGQSKKKNHVPVHGKWDVQKQAWVSLEGDVIVRKEKNLNLHIKEVKIQFQGEERWIKNTHGMCGSYSKSYTSPLAFFMSDRSAYLEGWVFVNPRNSDPALLICDHYTDEPQFALYMDPQEPDRYSVKQITQEGFSRGYALVNLGDLENLEGVFRKLACCSYPNNLLCLVEEKTGEIEEIKFAKQAFHFKKNTEGRLECITPYPGFYLDQSFHLEELGSFNGALVLKNAFGRRKVLMLPREIKTGFGDQAHKITLGNSLFVDEFISFELSPHSNDLFTTKTHAYLYLSYVMKAQKRYLDALRYLKKAQLERMGENTITLTEAFFEIKDGSLEAICINAHLSSRYFEFMRSMGENQFKENKKRFNGKLISKISNNYMEYLRVGGRVHAFVPQEFRLSKEQEKTLLFFLEDYYFEIQEKFPQTLSDRIRLILEHEVEGTIEDHPIPFSILKYEKMLQYPPRCLPGEKGSLRDYDSNTYPIGPYPVRISTPQLVANFFTLYSLACQPENPAFKYLLLALHHTTDKTELAFPRKNLSYILTKIFLCKKPMKIGVTDQDPPERKSKALEELDEYARDLPDPQFPEDQTFSLNRPFTLHSPFENKGAEVTLPSIEFEYEKTPLLPLAEQYLKQTPQGNKTLTPLPKIQTDTPLERSLDETLQKNQPPSIATPPIITLKNPSKLKEALLEQKKDNQRQIKKLQKEVHDLFAPHLGLQAAPFDTDEQVQETLYHYLSRKRGSSAPFSPEKIMLEVVLKGNPALLLQTFPLMTVNHAAEIIQRVQHYFHLQAVDVLITTSLDTLESLQKSSSDQELLQKLHGLLSFQFLYNPALHPELSLLVTKTRLLPREQQIKIHLWQCEQIEKEGSSLFQGGAGLGKSSYLTPLLILRLLKEECIPVVFSSQAMYSIDKKNLSSLLSQFGIKLDILEVGMHTQLTLKKLKLIYRNLLVCRDERRPLIMIPQSFYALKLMYLHGLKASEEKSTNLPLMKKFREFKDQVIEYQKESKKLEPILEFLYGETSETGSLDEYVDSLDRLSTKYWEMIGSTSELMIFLKSSPKQLDEMTSRHLNKIIHNFRAIDLSKDFVSPTDPPMQRSIKILEMLIAAPKAFLELHHLFYELYFPTDWDALDSPERIEYLSKICDFMKKHCRLICDESHLVFDANTTAIFGFGELMEENPAAYTLYIQLLYPLLGIETLGINEEQTAHTLFLECQQMSGNEANRASDWETKIHLIQRALSERMVPQILEALPKKEHASYCEFVYHPELPAPSSFGTLSKEKADQIGYLRFFLTTLLPPLTQMKLGRDHNPSPYPKQDFHTPCHKGVATTTQFLEALQTIVVTIKGVFESGLTEEQVIAHLSLLVLKASTYSRLNEIDGAQLLSNAEISFAKWTENTPYQGRTLGSLDLQNPEEKKALNTYLSHNKAMITDMLQTTILPQIKFPKYQIELTPADLANMGKAFAFSATPGPLQTLPTHFKRALYNHQATSQVVSTMLQTENLTQIHPTSLAAEDFFTYLKEKKAVTFRESRALIDLGGAFAHLPNQKIASLWLETSGLDGVFFFQKNQGLTINREDEICLLLQNGNVITFEGSRLQEAMNQTIHDYTTMKLGVFYDVSHTESADVPILGHLPSFNILFIPGSDDRFTYSAAVQAVMRIRDFLSPTKKRKLIWVFLKGTPSKKSEELYREMVKNEATSVHSRILHAAAQEIATVIRASLETQLSPDTEATEQIQLIKEHEKAFISERKHDPSKTFCAAEETLAVGTILTAFASSYYNKCYGNSEIPKKMNKKIQELIARASSLVETASSAALENPDREVEIETEIKEEKKAHRPKPDDPIRAAPIYGKVSIKEEGFIEKTAHYLSTDLFGPAFSPFYFTDNQIKTAKFYDNDLNEKKLKPIDFFIILFDKEGKVHIRATVNESVNKYMEDLTQTEELPFVGHRALIMTGDGHVVRRGRGLMQPAPKEEEEFLKSKEYQNLIIDRAFLEARLPKDLKATIQRIQEWGPFFRLFYDKVLEAQPHKEDIDTDAFKKVIDIALGTSNLKQDIQNKLSNLEKILARLSGDLQRGLKM